MTGGERRRRKRTFLGQRLDGRTDNNAHKRGKKEGSHKREESESHTFRWELIFQIAAATVDWKNPFLPPERKMLLQDSGKEGREKTANKFK